MGRVLLAVAALLAASAAAAPAAPDGRFTALGTVSWVYDGDTVAVELASGRRERVRLIGIDTPERGECFGGKATREARRLALGRTVTLRGDATQATRDRYRRLLAYVWLPDGRDLGFRLLAGGHARVYVYGRPFERLRAYRRAERIGKRQRTSVWRCGETGSVRRCDPSYLTVCIKPPPPDLDCRDIPHRNFRVVGRDPHGFDGNGDGVGCED